MKEQQVQELESQADHLRRIEPDKVDEIEQRRILVAERWVRTLIMMGQVIA